MNWPVHTELQARCLSLQALARSCTLPVTDCCGLVVGQQGVRQTVHDSGVFKGSAPSDARYRAHYVSTVTANGSSIMDAVHFLAAETCRAALTPSPNKAYTTRSSNALQL